MSSHRKRLTFNVSGETFETYEDTLQRFPRTLLGSPHQRNIYYSIKTQEYFFNRNRACFAYILFFYQSNGILRCPNDIPMRRFEDECRFYQLPERSISFMKEQAGILLELQKGSQHGDRSGTLRAAVWNLLEHPESSNIARVYTLCSISAIVLSIAATCISTMPSIREKAESQNNISASVWLIIELTFNIFFLIEFLTRFTCCPKKMKYMQSLMNWIDAGAILPYFLMLCVSSCQVMSLGFLRILRLVRILRLFRLNKLYSRRMKIISAIIRSAIDDFKMLVVLLIFTITLIGNAMYHIEKSPASDFTDIPNSNWWAIITMTTSGYGDVVPMTVLGRLVASFYMLFGAMTITLPALSIGSKLKTIYDKNVRLDEMLNWEL